MRSFEETRQIAKDTCITAQKRQIDSMFEQIDELERKNARGWIVRWGPNIAAAVIWICLYVFGGQQSSDQTHQSLLLMANSLMSSGDHQGSANCYGTAIRYYPSQQVEVKGQQLVSLNDASAKLESLMEEVDRMYSESQGGQFDVATARKTAKQLSHLSWAIATCSSERAARLASWKAATRALEIAQEHLPPEETYSYLDTFATAAMSYRDMLNLTSEGKVREHILKLSLIHI